MAVGESNCNGCDVRHDCLSLMKVRIRNASQEHGSGTEGGVVTHQTRAQPTISSVWVNAKNSTGVFVSRAGLPPCEETKSANGITNIERNSKNSWLEEKLHWIIDLRYNLA